MIVIPVVLRTTEDMLLLVPNPLREAASALGLPRSLVIKRIAYRAARSGLITGVLLATARVAGETAPLLFTTSVFSNLAINYNPSQALANIPTTIFTLSESPTPSDHAKAWAAALVLIAFVLIVSLVARTFNERSRRKLGG